MGFDLNVARVDGHVLFRSGQGADMKAISSRIGNYIVVLDVSHIDVSAKDRIFSRHAGNR